MARNCMCITRYPGQRIIINEHVEIMVARTRGSQVSIKVFTDGVRVQIPTKEQDRTDRAQFKDQEKKD